MSDEENLDFVKTHFPDYLSLYLNLPRDIMRADVIRYMWLYIKGGVYIDLDYEAIKPFDSLFASGELYLVESPNFKG